MAQHALLLSTYVQCVNPKKSYIHTDHEANNNFIYDSYYIYILTSLQSVLLFCIMYKAIDIFFVDYFYVTIFRSTTAD